MENAQTRAKQFRYALAMVTIYGGGAMLSVMLFNAVGRGVISLF